jgi:hypothetical protein
MAETRITSENIDNSITRTAAVLCWLGSWPMMALKFCAKPRHGVGALSCKCQTQFIQEYPKKTGEWSSFEYY